MNRINHRRYESESLALFGQRDRAYMENPDDFANFLSVTPSIQNIEHVIEQKHSQFSATRRNLLHKKLTQQYDTLGLKHRDVIDKIKNQNTFCIITAHQPCLFTGPLYFIYKIASTIALANKLNDKFPAYTFLPLYVLGSEDHDLEEINHTWLYRKKITWNTDQKGAVGRMKLDEINSSLSLVDGMISNTAYGSDIVQILKNAYTSERTLAQATHHLVHHIFSREELLIIDLDDSELKMSARELFQKELEEQFSLPLVRLNQEKFEQKGFKPQVYGRPINLFFLDQNDRIRLESKDKKLYAGNTLIAETASDFIDEQLAQKLSPNVILRPLYQQTVLPGIVYIGGGSEVAYWMELSSAFNAINLSFPMLLRRDSAMVITSRIRKLMTLTEISQSELFTSKRAIQDAFLGHIEDENWQLAPFIQKTNALFKELRDHVHQIDSGMDKMISGAQQQQINFAQKLEQKLKRVIKQKHEVHLNRLDKLWEELFPDGGLQERKDNFLPIYAEAGPAFIDGLIQNFDSFETGMHFFELPGD